MARIAIYDSGIGGLTTLAKLICNFEHCDFLYYADNANFPLGSKTQQQIEAIARQNALLLKKRCDYTIFACNTASSHLKDESIIKLLPPLDDLEPAKTLVLATDGTYNMLKIKERGFLTIHTPELASLITKAYLSVNIDYTLLEDIHKHIAFKLLNLKFQNIVIGCSHYIYLSDELKKLYPNVNVYDGNNKIVDTLKQSLSKTDSIGAVYFEFSKTNCYNQYVDILEKLLCDNTSNQV